MAIAKAWTARAYREIALLGHQLHGGAGYVFGSAEEWLEDPADRLALGPSAG